MLPRHQHTRLELALVDVAKSRAQEVARGARVAAVEELRGMSQERDHDFA
ncbi:MAG: hypothetical protein U0802_11880 [Candidatus Binatia bacterium]